MANVINTRIQLKYDTLSNWNASTFKPLKGEVCIAKVDVTQPENSLLQPIMFKVGDGDHTFAELGWTSAKAADVYAWAKEASITVNKDGTGNVVAGIEWDDTANGGKGGLKYTTESVATSEGLEAVQKAIEDINKELDTFGDIVTYNAAEFATKSEFDTLKGKVEDEDGALAKAKSAYELAETKLATATFTEFQITNAQAIADAKSGAETTAAGELTKARGEITTEIGNAVAPLATTEALNGVKAIAEAAAPQATTYNKTEVDGLVKTAKDAADAAQGTANEAKIKIDTFLGTITPDGSADIIDTLAEINTNITENTDAFTGLSGRVTNIENGTTIVPKAGNADKLDDHDSTYFATAEGLLGLNETVAKMAIAPEEGGTGVAYAAKAGEANAATTASKVENALKIQYSDSDIEEYNGDEEVTIDLSAYQPAGNYVQPGDLAEIATTGSIYDVEEGAYVSTGKDDPENTEYLIFNCGSATTII